MAPPTQHVQDGSQRASPSPSHFSACVPGPSRWHLRPHKVSLESSLFHIPHNRLIYKSGLFFLLNVSECICVVPRHHLSPQAPIICCLDGFYSLLTGLLASTWSPFNALHGSQSPLFKLQPAGDSPLTNPFQDMVSASHLPALPMSPHSPPPTIPSCFQCTKCSRTSFPSGPLHMLLPLLSPCSLCSCCRAGGNVLRRLGDKRQGWERAESLLWWTHSCLPSPCLHSSPPFVEPPPTLSCVRQQEPPSYEVLPPCHSCPPSWPQLCIPACRKGGRRKCRASTFLLKK